MSVPRQYANVSSSVFMLLLPVEVQALKKRAIAPLNTINFFILFYSLIVRIVSCRKYRAALGYPDYAEGKVKQIKRIMYLYESFFRLEVIFEAYYKTINSPEVVKQYENMKSVYLKELHEIYAVLQKNFLIRNKAKTDKS